MAEYERIREKALLAPDEKDMIINMATKLTDPMPLIEVMRFGDAIAQAQLEKVLKTDGICIKSDDQGLPCSVASPCIVNMNTYADGERHGYYQGLGDMLNEGWVKCRKKE